MKITEELLNEMKIKDENFSDGLIKPDGDYVRIPRGHLHGMMELLPWTENEIWKMIPDDDSPLFWLIEKTGCVLTDYNNSIGMKMTPAQQTVFDMMRKHGVLTDDYYDLTKQREKVREAREQKETHHPGSFSRFRSLSMEAIPSFHEDVLWVFLRNRRPA